MTVTTLSLFDRKGDIMKSHTKELYNERQHNKRRGKWGMMLAALAMVAVLATGCSGGQNPVETVDPAPTEEEKVSEDTSAATTSEEPVSEEESGSTEDIAVTENDSVTIRIGALSGPTAMGLVKLMDDAEQGTAENTYEFAELSSDPSAFVAPLTKGELDIAAVPSNLASVLYNNTEGGIQVLAINNLCVLNIVERGDSIQTMADLKDKKIYATGQGAVPEYTLRYLLNQNEIDPDADVEIQWCADTTEALSYVSSDEAAIAMLPQPFVTVALSQVEDLRLAIDLNEEWNSLNNGCKQVTGVVVVRKEFAEEHPAAVETFLKEYEASVNYTSEDAEGAAALIEKYGIVPKAPVALKALPGCHLKYESGSEMKNSLEGFLQILYDENPKAVGGSLPGEDFYYGL